MIGIDAHAHRDITDIRNCRAGHWHGRPRGWDDACFTVMAHTGDGYPVIDITLHGVGGLLITVRVTCNAVTAPHYPRIGRIRITNCESRPWFDEGQSKG